MFATKGWSINFVGNFSVAENAVDSRVFFSCEVEIHAECIGFALRVHDGVELIKQSEDLTVCRMSIRCESGDQTCTLLASPEGEISAPLVPCRVVVTSEEELHCTEQVCLPTVIRSHQSSAGGEPQSLFRPHRPIVSYTHLIKPHVNPSFLPVPNPRSLEVGTVARLRRRDPTSRHYKTAHLFTPSG